MNGGELIAQTLQLHGVRAVFTLIGGHISPILVSCKKARVRVVDVRHEVNTVFAADASARLTGIPGVAVVTAGPGVTNTLTALKNAQMAQSPLVLIGGATATVLKNRGSLQDIDQIAAVKPHVKWHASAKKVRDLPRLIATAFMKSREGVPGPVFVEVPVDLLYEESTVREWYMASVPRKPGLKNYVISRYLSRHVDTLFRGADLSSPASPMPYNVPSHTDSDLRQVVERLQTAAKPLLVIGSQAMLQPQKSAELARAVDHLGIPVYLAGMARGLLGKKHKLQLRHKRAEALKECDLVILAGVPVDFRLNYGSQIRSSAFHIGVNRSSQDLKKNKRPSLALKADVCDFLISLSSVYSSGAGRLDAWISQLRARDLKREEEILSLSAKKTKNVNALKLLFQLKNKLPDNAILVADGGDFVATAAYILEPPAPLSWLDPGVFGTLGVGAGFALGASVVCPDREVWIIYGDGSAGYSIMEYDTFVRHRFPVIGLIGNDACWTQIYRDQKEILKDDIACMLLHTDYHKMAEATGATGFLIARESSVASGLTAARKAAQKKSPVLINAIIDISDFRKGSISM